MGSVHGPLTCAVMLAAACSTSMGQSGEERWQTERARMVDEQIRARGVRSERVLAAMRKVPRHLFVPEDRRPAAYTDFPLSIGFGQTISQPYIVAFMTEALDVEPTHRVLEIGTGSGYQAAILGELAQEVFTIEIVPELAERARKALEDLGYTNIHVRAGNGYAGWPEEAPFDRIMVTAAPEDVPPALVEQLKMDGILVIPVGVGDQLLKVMQRTPAGMKVLKTLPVRFVPMTGKPGQ